MFSWTRGVLSLLLISLVFFLGACGGSAAIPEPASPEPNQAPVEEPTKTELRQPVVAFVPSPAFPTVTVPAGSSGGTPPALATIPGQIGPDFYPENVNPLTGLSVDPAVLQRRPFAVKLANTPSVRPQAGLNSADIVYEHYTEGGITRFTAIFYTNDVDRVGSIRSARLIDLEIPVMYQAAFAYSGSSAPIRLMIRGSSFFDRVVSPDFAHGGFERLNDERNPSTQFVDSLFTNTNTLRWILDQRGQNVAPPLSRGMAFNQEPPPNGVPARSIQIEYIATNVSWDFDGGSQRYRRWSDGIPHLDANTDEQLSFRNIIVLFAPHVNTEIVEDTNGSPSIQIQIWDQGPAMIFRDGLRYDGSWIRHQPSDMLTFVNAEGSPIPLAPGNTFIEVVPIDFSALTISP